MMSPCIQELKGHDGEPFVSSRPLDVRLCLGLFIDWFNANGNNLRGSRHSTGGVYMVILNLPAEIRYQKQNMFHLLTPGPREPTTDQLNNYIRPLVNELLVLYQRGIQVPFSPGVLSVQAMVAIIIADLPAARKISGFASIHHEHFCCWCGTAYAEFKSKMDPSHWSPSISPREHHEAAKLWLHAESTKERQRSFQQHGVRYSELERLGYLHLGRSTLLEPMHAIHINLVAPHIRRVFSLAADEGDFEDDMDPISGDEEEEHGNTPLTNSQDGEVIDDESRNLDYLPFPREYRRATQILRRPSLNIKALELLMRMHLETLTELCHQSKTISLHELHLRGGKPTKLAMVEALGLSVSYKIISVLCCDPSADVPARP
jgi:hypothetical protein